MFKNINKKTIAIISASLAVAMIIGVSTYIYLGRDEAKPLPTVKENVIPDPTVNPEPNPDVTMKEPVADVEEGALVVGDLPPIEEDPVAEAPAPKDEAKQNATEIEVEKQIAENEKQLQAEAAKLKTEGKSIEEMPVKPAETPPPVPETPNKLPNGQLYTIADTVKKVKDYWAAGGDPNGETVEHTLANAKEVQSNFSQEKFDADLKKVINDPMSSSILALYIEGYTYTGDKIMLMGDIHGWLSRGGDEAVSSSKTF